MSFTSLVKVNLPAEKDLNQLMPNKLSLKSISLENLLESFLSCTTFLGKLPLLLMDHVYFGLWIEKLSIVWLKTQSSRKRLISENF